MERKTFTLAFRGSPNCDMVLPLLSQFVFSCFSTWPLRYVLAPTLQEEAVVVRQRVIQLSCKSIQTLILVNGYWLLANTISSSASFCMSRINELWRHQRRIWINDHILWEVRAWTSLRFRPWRSALIAQYYTAVASTKPVLEFIEDVLYFRAPVVWMKELLTGICYSHLFVPDPSYKTGRHVNLSFRRDPKFSEDLRRLCTALLVYEQSSCILYKSLCRTWVISLPFLWGFRGGWIRDTSCLSSRFSLSCPIPCSSPDILVWLSHPWAFWRHRVR